MASISASANPGERSEQIISLAIFSEDMRKVIYTPNTIKSLNMILCRATRNHRIFPSDEIMFKVIYLAMLNITTQWTMPTLEWKTALDHFAVECAGRFPK